MENTANHITLTGTLASLPEYSHQNHERRFFRFLLAVERLSGTEDLLPVLAAEDVLEQAELFEGERFTIEGQIRSFNNREPTGRRLILCVYALSMMTTDAPMQNEAVLTGTVCKPPVYRQTPLGRQITDLCLAVPRLYRRTDYIPCILWGRTALAAAEYPTGTELTLTPPPKPDLSQESGRDERNTHRIRTFRQRLRARPGIRNFLEKIPRPVQPPARKSVF